ncbi:MULTISPECIES: hypothetical protein [Enterococcus]|uniref:hypothetical protein n=1 Tax=Enterococcus TaxID=1350 RepID=UPI000A3638D9|nr:hypothetical protein [Enterococcus sp. 4E1_DIV0656]OTO09109.1 hypothetical protein A5882_003439 [Enterococcus sp. 4E1_DIV0656]
MDLKNKYKEIISKYGYDILLLQQNKKRRCSCYDEKTQSADRRCPFCYGLGYVSTITRQKIRDIDSGVPVTLPLITATNTYGGLSVATRAYYFLPEATLTENDLIIDVEWQGDTPIYTGKGIYQIAHIDPQRFEGGELIFNKAYVKDTPINKQIRGFKIVQDNNKVFYELSEERG